ncbi:deoxyguanosinetriphosphate triphosphohydrolase [Pontibacter sp. KCTC 32443]|uniref:deoxyguanosinetriphosphate triphosphohydrolase n=1 Tax=Pontibacter TaxID=323449 RepID=UPI00164D287E|nr:MULTISPECIES: deoxyguanosinetriphosphate triphosphohydrolase [Pontibacter]MBC5775781.1 deoxyguanosinetriphosphate triphosphohydrolase [Pontibacter sp. KCTC 32443]
MIPSTTWGKLISKKRFESTDKKYTSDESVRGEFQRDYDRIVFSSAFRRLQNKTQVMPMPESDFVHTRLTHSLEASVVGRTLGRIVGKSILERNPQLTEEKYIQEADFGDIVAAACLAHDIGNPPFGHSGEDAISSYFESEAAQPFMQNLTEAQRKDLLNFEGNAAGFRVLTYTYSAHCNLSGGLSLTYTTLATFTKYPKESLPVIAKTKNTSEKKYGFFQTEKSWFNTIAQELGLLRKGDGDTVFYHRHPLAFLVEAADDICYRVIDFEDGLKLGLVTKEQGIALLKQILNDDPNRVSSIKFYDWREEIGYLRARIIGKLIEECAAVFLEHEQEILAGAFDTPLINLLHCKSVLDEIKMLSIEKIYRNKPVLEIEAAGFEVLSGLLDACMKAVFLPESKRHRKLADLIPAHYINLPEHVSDYERIIHITDFVTSLTDQAAINLYRKIKGIELPRMY